MRGGAATTGEGLRALAELDWRSLACRRLDSELGGPEWRRPTQNRKRSQGMLKSIGRCVASTPEVKGTDL